MDVPALIAHALSAVHGNQAELARRLGRSETTVSRWVAGRNGIDYESCLRLAKITGLPARNVVEIAGLDPNLLPPGEGMDSPGRALTPLQADIQQRTVRIQAAVDATEGLPDDFVEVYLRKVLDNTEDEITAMIRMVHQVRESQPRRTNNTGGRRSTDVGKNQQGSDVPARRKPEIQSGHLVLSAPV